jgi:hypothetical protein
MKNTLAILIKKYEELDRKEDNGTATFEEVALKHEIYQRMNDILFNN